jgi:hypothetical protein
MTDRVTPRRRRSGQAVPSTDRRRRSLAPPARPDRPLAPGRAPGSAGWIDRLIRQEVVLRRYLVLKNCLYLGVGLAGFSLMLSMTLFDRLTGRRGLSAPPPAELAGFAAAGMDPEHPAVETGIDSTGSICRDLNGRVEWVKVGETWMPAQ